MAVAAYVSALFENVKKIYQEFDIKKWAESVGGSSAEAVEAAVYFCLSFAIGFLCKKYFKIVFMCIVASFLTIKAFEYAQFLIVDWQAIKLYAGITQTSDFNSILNACFDWISGHLLLFIASTVGFLVGYKLG